MHEQNWQKVHEVFAVAASMRGKERSEYLDTISTQDKALHCEVVSLLSAEEFDEILPNSSAVVFYDSEAETPIANHRDLKTRRAKPDMVGETISNRYLIKKLIGSGGMGEVFLAEDKNVMNREVIVKLLKSDAVENSEIVRKFKQEVEALARIKDEGIVTIYDFGTFGEQPFLVLEYVEGEDLSKIISPVLFSARDFINPQAIVRKLREQKTPEMAQVWGKLTTETRFLLENTSETQAENLRDGFNKLLKNWSLYNEQGFSNFKLSAKASEALKKREETDRTSAFNRALLEDLFPNEIVKGEKKLLPQSTVSEIFNQLCVSLMQGHRKGVIHRDLKPANIMVTETEGRGLRVKLIDFGVARVRESLVAPTTALGIAFGTQNYMSPEQLIGEKNLTHATDIYSLGLIALEILTGKNPFNGKSSVEQYRLQENAEIEEIDELKKLPEATANVILRSLAFKPEDRFSTAQDFSKALSNALHQANANAQKKTVASDDVVIAETVVDPYIPDDSIRDENPINPVRPIITPPQDYTNSNKSISKFLVPVFALTFLIVVGGVSFLIYKQLSKNQNIQIDNVGSKEILNLSYKLIVQKYYEGKPFQKPFDATGDEIFGDDWRFRLWLQSPQDGHLYLLTEGIDSSGNRTLAMLFPHPQRNNGNSAIKADQPIETNEMEFDKNQGVETFWIVWSKKAVDELEAVKSYVNPQDLGTIKDAAKEQAVRDFLKSNSKKEKLKEQKDSNKSLKTLQITDNVLVKFAEFRHN